MTYTNIIETKETAIEKILWEALEYRMELLYLSHKYRAAKKEGNKDLANDLLVSCEYVRGYLLGTRNVLELTGIEYKVNVSKDRDDVTITYNGKVFTVEERVKYLNKGIATLRSYRGNAEALGVSETSLITSIVDLSETLDRLNKDVEYLKKRY